MVAINQESSTKMKTELLVLSAIVAFSLLLPTSIHGDNPPTKQIYLDCEYYQMWGKQSTPTVTQPTGTKWWIRNENDKKE